jgi:hypothetical protein
VPLRNPLELFDHNSGAKLLMSTPKPKQREVRSVVIQRHHVSLATCLFIFQEQTCEVEFAKSISSNNCRACRTANRPEKVQIHCHPDHSVVIEPVSSNRRH